MLRLWTRDDRPALWTSPGIICPVSDPVIQSLLQAVERAPADQPLRLHLAELLIGAGRGGEAVAHLAAALAADPESDRARELMARALAPDAAVAPDPADAVPPDDLTAQKPATERPGSDVPGSPASWQALEEQLSDVVPPMFVDGGDDPAQQSAFDVEHSGIRLADVGGMEKVKERLDAAFLAPMRNPELRRLYGKSLRGGLLLYGPPGCGKTFLARAVAGELGAGFLTVSLADILDMYIGNSEKNLAELFARARAAAPCVLFLDELDALGQKRTQARNSGMRSSVNQLLTELDGVSGDNDGVYVLAATNQPWDVDPALRRPGRLDRTLLVLPPDRPAREAIFRYHLQSRPVERIDVTRLAKRTDGYSGADLAYVCESASENAILDSIRTGVTRMIRMQDLEQALAEVRPSIGPWVDTARNVALFANESGEYDELAAFIRRYRG